MPCLYLTFSVFNLGLLLVQLFGIGMTDQFFTYGGVKVDLKKLNAGNLATIEGLLFSERLVGMMGEVGRAWLMGHCSAREGSTPDVWNMGSICRFAEGNTYGFLFMKIKTSNINRERLQDMRTFLRSARLHPPHPPVCTNIFIFIYIYSNIFICIYIYSCSNSICIYI